MNNDKNCNKCKYGEAHTCTKALNLIEYATEGLGLEENILIWYSGLDVKVYRFTNIAEKCLFYEKKDNKE